jgi:dolichol-phosphate mannosyltransferase
MPSQVIKKVFLGLPAYNEQDSIQPLFEKIFKLKQTTPLDLEILFYDDGCTDSTKEKVRQWSDKLNITYLDGVINKGLGIGTNELLNYFVKNGTDIDVLVIMDCDDTHDPAQIPDMLTALEKNKDCNIVIASRYRKGAFVKGVPMHRVLMSIGAAILYKCIHPLKNVLDYTCGYRLYTHDIIMKTYTFYKGAILKERGFACMVELLLKLKKSDANVVEIPLLLRYDNKRSDSKMDVSSNAFRLLKKLWDWRIRGML